MSCNNPAVGLITRRFLWKLVALGDLDQECARLLQRALEKTVPIHPGGLVLRLADALGATGPAALDAASFAELFYAMASLTDDLQDGDAQRDLPELTPAMRLNVLAQLMCVTVARGADLAERLGAPRALAELGLAFRAGAAMLCGQRLELLRERWSASAWRAVAEQSAGRQFQVYFRLAAAAAGREEPHLVALGMPLGVLVQLRQDRDEADPRLVELPAGEIGKIEQDAIAAAQAQLASIPAPAVAVLRPQLERMGAWPARTVETGALA